ncbi:SGNH/GDSL hydrolase family protein [Bacillus infantis]|uniref:SGNH/GDSL hydrolase family protein n=1 Tax=Bacillus infantis TaxID=324767 RepID=UPI002005900D|nr:SGNH/GDSL hydrolase family protein [Bacillus infantis]
MKSSEEQAEKLIWHDPKEAPFVISGFAWFQDEKKYRRLPSEPDWIIPDIVSRLADCTAGGQIRFQTNAKTIAVKVKLSGKADMSNMPATGQCGFDCYIGPAGHKHFVNITRYEPTLQEYELAFFEREETDLLPITLNFPLYQGVGEVLVGANEGAVISEPAPFDSGRKIILYGTSILQGGCASRPGMAYPNIISRKINLEFINLGFSGSGRGEPNMAKIIRTIENPACLVLDYEPNCVSTELYKKTLPEFIRIYRETHPYVPIILVSKFPYAAEAVDRQLYEDRIARLVFQKNLVQELQQKGDQNITFIEGTNMLGEYTNEATVDGVHPTDLGFIKMAEYLGPVIAEAAKGCEQE